MSSETPTNAQPLVLPSISETSTSALSICLKSASDVNMPSKRTAPKESSSASTLAKKKKKEHEKEKKSSPKKAVHKSHTLSGTGKRVGSALSPLQQAQPDIMTPPILELMVLPPIELMDSPIQQLDFDIGGFCGYMTQVTSGGCADLQGVENIDPGPPGVEGVNPAPLDAESIGIGLRTTIIPD
ncbi:UNVERIFIED_CONTAM: hypothetical protein K2H54_063244 [Gekko kuhli]